MASSTTLSSTPAHGHINQTLLQIIYILHFCPVYSLLYYAADFIVNCYYAALLPRRGRIMRRTLSVRLSVRPVIVTERHVAPPSELQWNMYFSARTEGRISYGHLGRTDSCLNPNWLGDVEKKDANLSRIQCSNVFANTGLITQWHLTQWKQGANVKTLTWFIPMLCCDFITELESIIYFRISISCRW